MTPYQFLLLTLGLTAASVAANLIHRRQRRRALHEMARSWRMHYSPRDVFRIADHLGPRLDVPGAADVGVVDVVYGNEGEFHRYIFSLEYTVGVTRAKHRLLRVASFCEPRGRTDSSKWSPLELAPAQGSLLDQYGSLHAQHEPAQFEASTAPSAREQGSVA